MKLGVGLFAKGDYLGASDVLTKALRQGADDSTVTANYPIEWWCGVVNYLSIR